MKNLLILISLVISGSLFAQMDNTLALHHVVSGYTDGPHSQVLVYASYPGGKAAFRQYLADHISYPNLARAYGVEGVVQLEFRIGPDGRADMIRIVEGPGYGCGEEAERLIRQMPQWLPALENGIATTDRKRNVAIQFRLN
jgi:TonB family protein